VAKPWIKSTRIDSTLFNWTSSVPATLPVPLRQCQQPYVLHSDSASVAYLSRGYHAAEMGERQTTVCGPKEFSWNHFSSCTTPTFYIMFVLCALPNSVFFWNTNYAQYQNTFSYGLAMVQGVNCLFTAEAWLRSENSPCRICGGSGFGTGFLPGNSPFTSVSFHKSLH